MKMETERSFFPVRFSPELQTLYIAHSITVALGIGKLLFAGHSSKSLHCSICPNAQLPKQPFLFSCRPFLTDGKRKDYLSVSKMVYERVLRGIVFPGLRLPE